MKQVIVRIRDCKATYSKTIAKAYFYSKSHYESEVIDFVKTLMPHQEIEISFGRELILYYSYEQLQEYARENEWTFDKQLYHSMIENDSIGYELANYLPRY